MIDFDRIPDVKEAAQSRRFVSVGARAVRIGSNTSGGQRTSEPIISFFVVRTRALPQLPLHQVNTEIDGVQTDEYEFGVFQYANCIVAQEKAGCVIRLGTRQR